MTTPTVTQIDPWRVDVHVNGRLVAYAIADQYGWALMARREGRIQTVDRIEKGDTAWRNARVGPRLFAVAVGNYRLAGGAK